MEHAYIWMLILLAVVGWLVYEIRRAPIEDFDRNDYADDTAAVDECIAASRPADLRPHIRAGSAWGREVR